MSIVTALRSYQGQKPQEPEVQEPRPKPSADGPMIEFIKKDGISTHVIVRSRGRVYTLKMNRNADDELVSATLMRD